MGVRRIPRLRMLGVVALLLVGTCASAAEPLLPIPILVCQQTIGNEALRFVKRLHKAERTCRDAVARGAACDTAKRDGQVADARAKLTRLLVARCGAIALEQLGFPGLCADASGPPFTVGELDDCVDGAHTDAVAAAIATAYPGSPAPLAGATLRCQAAIGNSGERFLAQYLRARQSCRNDQLSGAVSAAVACEAAPPPGGSGTGHLTTDRRLAVAASRLATQLEHRCAGIDLTTLGFPAGCADPDGPPFALADLTHCLGDHHAADADALFATEYPALP